MADTDPARTIPDGCDGTEARLGDCEASELAVRRLAGSSATARYVFPPGSVNERTAAAMRPQER